MTRSILIRSRKNAFAIAAAGALVAAAGAVALAAPAQAEAKTVTESVYVSAQQGNQFLVTPQKVTVKSNEAEKFGYTDQVDKNKGVSQLDVLVKAHEVKYGKKFTKKTAQNYFKVPLNSWGSYGITKAFGVDTTAWGIVANNKAAVDETSPYSAWGYATQYTVNQASVKNNDAVNLFAYGDATAWSDGFSYFAKNAKNKSYATAVSGYTGKQVKLNAQELAQFSANGAKNSSDRAKATAALNGAKLATVGKSGKLKTLKANGKAVTTNKSGNASVTFKKPGSYVVSATPVKGTYATSPWVIVKVKAAKGYTTTVKGAKYQVTNASKNHVTYVKAPKSKKTVSVPSTVKIGGTSYQVTKIATKAFSNNKKVKTVKVGKNVAKISKSAFSKVPNLKKISVSSKHLKAKSTVKSAFKGSKLKKNLTVNANQIATKYVKKSFTKKNLKTPKKVVLTRTVTNI